MFRCPSKPSERILSQENIELEAVEIKISFITDPKSVLLLIIERKELTYLYAAIAITPYSCQNDH